MLRQALLEAAVQMRERESAVVTMDATQPESVYIRPTKFFFPQEQTIASGFIAYEPNGNSQYHYPILSDWQKEPLQFLHESILVGRPGFRSMMRRAYLNKWRIKVGHKEIFWIEYEALFSDQSFYETPSECKIASVKSLQDCDLQAEQACHPQVFG